MIIINADRLEVVQSMGRKKLYEETIPTDIVEMLAMEKIFLRSKAKVPINYVLD